MKKIFLLSICLLSGAGCDGYVNEDADSEISMNNNEKDDGQPLSDDDEIESASSDDAKNAKLKSDINDRVPELDKDIFSNYYTGYAACGSCDSPLGISGTTPMVQFTESDADPDWNIANWDGDLRFRHDNSTRFIFTGDDKMGVGTYAPESKLHVLNQDSGLLVQRSSAPDDDVPYYGVQIANLASSTCDGDRQVALMTPDVNQFVWSPYLTGGAGEFGVYWSTNGNNRWNSGANPSNPNELIFVGYGDKKASISLSTGDAHFNHVEAAEVVVEPNYWADYVFKDDYELASLKDVEKFINDNGHLPKVPSAEKVAKEGIALSKTAVVLLEKIEELTLYTIAQQKEIDSLERALKRK